MENNLPKYLTIRQASVALGVSIDTLRRWEKQGKLKTLRSDGGHRRYSLTDIQTVKSSRENGMLASSHNVSRIEVAAPVLHYATTPVSFPLRKALTILIVTGLLSLSALNLNKIASSASGLLSQVGINIPFLEANLNDNSETSESKVLALITSTNLPTFKVNIQADFFENVDFEKDVAIAGTLTAQDITATDTLTGATGNITGDLTVGGNIDEINGVDYTFPTVDASGFLKSDGSGTLTWSAVTIPTSLSDLSGVLPIAKGGTNNSDTYTSGSIIFSDGTKLTQDNTNLAWNDSDNLLKLMGVSYAFPTSQGSAGTFLTNDGAGTLTWGTVGAAAITADSLDFTEFIDSMTLDANLAIASSASNFSINIDSDTLFVDTANNRVGIGTGSPSATLDVTGTALITNNTTSNTIVNLSSSGDFAIQDNGTTFLTFTDNGSVTLADNYLLDLSAVIHNDSAPQGIKLPQNTTFTNLSSGEGFLAWDTDGNNLAVFDGSSWVAITATNFWTDSGTITYLTSTTDDLAIGGTGATSPLFVDVSASALQLNPFGAGTGNTGEIRFTELAAQGTNYTGFKSPDSLAGNVVYTLPDADATVNNQVLASNTSGQLAWIDVSSGAGSHWTSTSSVVHLTNNTDDFALGGNNSESELFFDVSQSGLHLNSFGSSTGNTGEIRFEELEANGDNYTGFKSPDSLAGNVVYTLPDADGGASQVLATNASGVLSWIDISEGAGTPFTRSGTNVYVSTTTDEVIIGGSTPLSSAKLSIDGDTDQIQFIIQGNATQTTDLMVLETSAGADLLNVNNSGNLTLAGTLDINGAGTHDIAGTLNLSGNTLSASGDLTLDPAGQDVIIDGDLILNDTFTLQIGGKTGTAYNVFGDSGDAPDEVAIAADNDLYIGGDLEVDGTIYGSFSGTINPAFTTGSVIFQGASGLAQDNANFFWDDTNNFLGIGDATPDAFLEVLGTTEQLRLTHTDGTADARFTVSSTGDLTLDLLGSGTAEQLVLGDTDTINVGGSGSTDVAYNVIGDSTAAATSVVGSDDDLYIEGNVQIDGVLAGDATDSLRLQAGGTTTGASGNSSIFFLNSSGTTKGRLDTSAVITSELGDGADGDITVSSSVNINTDVIATGRVTYADGIAYRVNAPEIGDTSVTRFSGSDTISNGIAVGDEVILINLQGASGDADDVGKYEFLTVTSVSASSIGFASAITRSYNGTTASDQKVVIQRVPNYEDVTVSSGGTITSSQYETLTTTPTGGAGYLTGIVAFRASGTVTVSSGGTISNSAKGFSNNAASGSSQAGLQANGHAGDSSTRSCSANGNGGGGGGVGDAGHDAGGGAGGGHSAAGTSASGGAVAPNCNGVGGSAVGNTDQTVMFLGGGGGSGGAGAGGTGGAGGDGGGIIFVRANTITVAGTIASNGGNGSNGTGEGGGGGSGAGGAINLGARSVTLGSSLVTTTAGTAGTGANGGANGAAGSTGRIYVEYQDLLSGTSSPTATSNTTEFLASNSYGTLFIGSVNTSSADLAEYYVTGDRNIEAGDVVSLSSTKLLDDNSQEVVNKGVLRKTEAEYDSKIIGIISTSPGVTLGSIDQATGQADQRALALSGRVPVKIDPDSEPIEIGDFLTSSERPGMAKKATKSGYTIAKALEPWNKESGKTKIEAFVNLGYYMGSLTSDGYFNGGNSFIAQDLKLDLLNKSYTSLFGQTTNTQEDNSASESAEVEPETVSVSIAQALDKVIERLESIENDITLTKASGDSLVASDGATFNDINVLGNAVFGDTVVNGKLNVGSLTIDNLESSIDAVGVLKIQPLALGNIEFVGGNLVIDKDGNLNLKAGVVLGNSKIRDSVEIPANTTELKVTQSWENPPVTINVTPSYKTSVWVTEITKDGFTINVENAPSSPEEVYWWALW